MRAWPPLQLFIALLFLGGAIFLLSLVTRSEADSELSRSGSTKTAGSGDAVLMNLEMESTAPVKFERIAWGDESLPERGDFLRSWSHEFSGPLDQPLQLRGSFAEEDIPAALILVMEASGQKTRELVRWVRSPTFDWVLYPETWE